MLSIDRLINGRPTPRHEIENDILSAFLEYYERFTGYGFWAAVFHQSWPDKSQGEEEGDVEHAFAQIGVGAVARHPVSQRLNGRDGERPERFGDSPSRRPVFTTILAPVSLALPSVISGALRRKAGSS